MRLLDDADAIARVDRSEMLKHVLSLGLELQEGWTQYAAQVEHMTGERLHGIAVVGLGGSGAAGDYLATLADLEGSVPVRVLRGSRLPNWLTRGWLVVCCSYSGETAETLEAYREAGRRGLRRVAITAGGTLQRLAHEDATPIITIAYSAAPRAAFPHYLAALLQLARATNALPVTDTDIARGVIAHTHVVSDSAPTVLANTNLAKQAGEHAAASRVLILAGEHLAAAGRRMRNQLAENGKLWASFEEIPEVAHNAIEGLVHGPPVVVILEGAAQGTEVQRTAEAVADVAARQGHTVIRWMAPGQDRLAEMVGATTWGDLVSCYAAIARSVDPTPIDLISSYKESIQPAPAADRP